MTTGAPLPWRLLQVGVPVLAATVGLVAGLSPTLGLAAALGIVYVVIVFESLALGLALFAGVTFVESIGGLGGLSLAKGAGALLAFSWLARVATDRSGDVRVLPHDHPFATAAIVGLAGWALISTAWAEQTGVALDGASRWILNLAMFAIVYTAVRERQHVRWIFAVFVGGALLSGAAGLASGTASAADEARLAGSGVNANDLGELLIVAIILGGGLGTCRDLSVPARVLAFAASVLAIGALLATVSRGAIVGLVVALVLTPLLAGPRRRVLAVVLIVLAVGASATYLLRVAPDADLQRLTAADTTGTGRTDIWKVGWRMVQDKPAVGVGVGNYANSTVHYLFEAGAITRSDFIVDDPKAAHNVYLQVLAELGVVGLALFLGVIGFALRSLLVAARRFRAEEDRPMEVLSRALMIGLCGLLASSFFSTAIYSKQLWLLLALAVAINGLTRESRV